jgi:hypothetical protein
MNSDERKNILEWIRHQVTPLYANLLSRHCPEASGLPLDDDGDTLGDALGELDDNDLEYVLNLDAEGFSRWLDAFFHDEVLEGSFRHEAVEVLVQHVSDVMVEHPAISDAQIRRAIVYLAARSPTRNLLLRYNDDVGRWLKLIALVDSEDAGTGVD